MESYQFLEELDSLDLSAYTNQEEMEYLIWQIKCSIHELEISLNRRNEDVK